MSQAPASKMSAPRGMTALSRDSECERRHPPSKSRESVGLDAYAAKLAM